MNIGTSDKHRGRREALTTIFAGLVVCGFGLQGPASAQNQNGDVNLCAAGAPCFTNQQQSGNSVTFWWNAGSERYDFYNVRYATAAGDKQVENRSGRYTFTNVHPGGNYKISVQGCVKPTFGHSRCSDWVQDSIRTR
jgi:Fibronectin type III domain